MNSSDSIMRMKFRYIRWVGEGDRRDGWSDGKQAGGGGGDRLHGEMEKT